MCDLASRLPLRTQMLNNSKAYHAVSVHLLSIPVVCLAFPLLHKPNFGVCIPSLFGRFYANVSTLFLRGFQYCL